MTNPNAPYAAQPQQSGFQPQPQFQPQQPYVPRPVAPLRTQRGLLKYVLLGLVTFSIYDIWQMSEVGDSLNLLAFKRVVPEKLRTLDHGRPWSDDQFASTRLSSNRDMSR